MHRGLTASRTVGRRKRAAARTGAGVEIRVCGGFRPARVRVAAHRPITLVFVREETASCSERVVFPSFGRSATLPVGQRVVVELPAVTPGVYEFTCALNVLRGALVVE